MSRVAILIDGDNISSAHAPRIATRAKVSGQIVVHRAYTDATNGSGWTNVPGVRVIHAGSGKNAADLLLSIDTIEMALDGVFETVFIASSDSDFTHLAFRLRERGICVIGLGEEKASETFRAACSGFEILVTHRPKKSVSVASVVPELDRNIHAVISKNSKAGAGMRLSDLNAQMRADYGVKISTRPERTWRAYLAARPMLYNLDKRGPEARVRFLKSGFTD